MEYVEIDGVKLRLTQPDELKLNWIGNQDPVGKILAAWLVIDKQDIPLNPRITGKPGVGKTTLAYSAARKYSEKVYIFQCTMDTRPEDLIVQPIISENNTIQYQASSLVTAMIKGGVCILDEGNRMSEKSWASLAPLMDKRRYVESIIAGIKIKAHPNFRLCVTMNMDSSTYEIPEYIDSRLQPKINLEAPSIKDEYNIIKYNVPLANDKLMEFILRFLQVNRRYTDIFSVRDGINIARYYIKLKVLNSMKEMNGDVNNSFDNMKSDINEHSDDYFNTDIFDDEPLDIELMEEVLRKIIGKENLELLNRGNSKKKGNDNYNNRRKFNSDGTSSLGGFGPSDFDGFDGSDSYYDDSNDINAKFYGIDEFGDEGIDYDDDDDGDDDEFDGDDEFGVDDEFDGEGLEDNNFDGNGFDDNEIDDGGFNANKNQRKKFKKDMPLTDELSKNIIDEFENTDKFTINFYDGLDQDEDTPTEKGNKFFNLGDLIDALSDYIDPDDEEDEMNSIFEFTDHPTFFDDEDGDSQTIDFNPFRPITENEDGEDSVKSMLRKRINDEEKGENLKKQVETLREYMKERLGADSKVFDEINHTMDFVNNQIDEVIEEVSKQRDKKTKNNSKKNTSQTKKNNTKGKYKAKESINTPHEPKSTLDTKPNNKRSRKKTSKNKSKNTSKKTTKNTSRKTFKK